MMFASISSTAVAATRQCRKLLVVGNEFTFFDIIRNVFAGTGWIGSPQWLLCVGGSRGVCIPVWFCIVCWLICACVSVGYLVVLVGYLGSGGCWCFVCFLLFSFCFSGVSSWVVGNLGCLLVDVELLVAMIVSLSVLRCCSLFSCCFCLNVFVDVA